MNWQQWVLVGYFATAGLSVVAGIGKTREPIDPPLAVGVLVVMAGLIALVATS